MPHRQAGGGERGSAEGQKEKDLLTPEGGRGRGLGGAVGPVLFGGRPPYRGVLEGAGPSEPPFPIATADSRTGLVGLGIEGPQSTMAI